MLANSVYCFDPDITESLCQYYTSSLLCTTVPLLFTIYKYLVIVTCGDNWRSPGYTFTVWLKNKLRREIVQAFEAWVRASSLHSMLCIHFHQYQKSIEVWFPFLSKIERGNIRTAGSAALRDEQKKEKKRKAQREREKSRLDTVSVMRRWKRHNQIHIS